MVVDQRPAIGAGWATELPAQMSDIAITHTTVAIRAIGFFILPRELLRTHVTRTYAVREGSQMPVLVVSGE
jgi:hypothetical protein